MSTSELTAGAIFAGHLIERRLGAGGMGTVYLAEHPNLPMRVALKVLGPGRSDLEYAALFRREARLAAGLDHPNIVDIKDFGDEDGTLWMSMRYVAGGDAAALIRSSRSGIDPRRAVHIVTEAAKALDYAHEHEVIHRDVKPANIFVGPGDGGADRVLVGDFGIARSTDAAATRTDIGIRAFSEGYAPPEQRTGGRVDRRADVHALGVTLYELLTGHLPGAVLAAGQDRLPPPLHPVVAKATAGDPADRYPTCGELAQAASAALRRRRSSGTRIRQVPRRWVAAAAALVALLVAVAVFWTTRSDSGSDAVGVVGAHTTPVIATPRCHFSARVPVDAGRYAVLPAASDGNRGCLLSNSDQFTAVTGVRILQDALRRCYDSHITDQDGIFGDQTRSAVLYVQALHQIGQDAIFGPKTSGAMRWPAFRDSDDAFESCVQLGRR
ncbi:serine/threonine-protein kinase [Nocardia sp. NPDC050710]|uniref:serine/threonine-protein kinase n=1 Tax=Nocardia sp. NPDC050710 TaxID=3157220 RepID=UPI0033E1856E